MHVQKKIKPYLTKLAGNFLTCSEVCLRFLFDFQEQFKKIFCECTRP